MQFFLMHFHEPVGDPPPQHLCPSPGIAWQMRLLFLEAARSLVFCFLRDPADVSSESDSAMTSSTVSKLAEARRTTYLSGRWVCDDHNGDTSISITGPWIGLPNNGDYSAYYNWVEEKKTTQGPGKTAVFEITSNMYMLREA